MTLAIYAETTQNISFVKMHLRLGSTYLWFGTYFWKFIQLDSVYPGAHCQSEVIQFQHFTVFLKKKN